MEEATELANYLPLSCKTPKEQDYIEFLWDAFETNYAYGKFQFAFTLEAGHRALLLRVPRPESLPRRARASRC